MSRDTRTQHRTAPNIKKHTYISLHYCVCFVGARVYSSISLFRQFNFQFECVWPVARRYDSALRTNEWSAKCTHIKCFPNKQQWLNRCSFVQWTIHRNNLNWRQKHTHIRAWIQCPPLLSESIDFDSTIVCAIYIQYLDSLLLPSQFIGIDKKHKPCQHTSTCKWRLQIDDAMRVLQCTAKFWTVQMSMEGM